LSFSSHIYTEILWVVIPRTFELPCFQCQNGVITDCESNEHLCKDPNTVISEIKHLTYGDHKTVCSWMRISEKLYFVVDCEQNKTDILDLLGKVSVLYVSIRRKNEPS